MAFKFTTLRHTDGNMSEIIRQLRVACEGFWNEDGGGEIYHLLRALQVHPVALPIYVHCHKLLANMQTSNILSFKA
jgi:hypothetical protein